MTASRPVILLGGTNGAGKTSAAGNIVRELRIHHRLGTGFIREIVRAESSPALEPELFESTFVSADPIGRLVEQSRRIAPAVFGCIERAHREGTSLLIEGNHVIPELYAGHELIDFCGVLAEPADRNEHRGRILGETHVLRAVTEPQVDRIRAMGRWLVAQAEALGVPVLRDGQELLRHLNGLGVGGAAAVPTS